MTGRTIDEEVRRALRAEAEGWPVPPDLARRTVEAALAGERGSLGMRLRALRDARWARGRSSGFPRWAYAGAAAAAVAGLFALGRLGEPAPEQVRPPRAQPLGARAPATAQAPTTVAAEPELRALTSTAPGAAGGPADQAAAGGRPVAGTVPAPPAFPPKVVRTADLQVQVRPGRFEAAWRRATAVAARYQGFVTESSTELVRGRLARGTLTARVPADRLEAALADFRALGTVVRLTTTGSDVSGQLVDYDARLRAMQAQEAQLLELMRQARRLSDTLEIRSRLDQVRQEMESLRAQREALQNQVDYATVTATIYEPDAAPAEPGPGGTLVRGWRRAVDGALTVVAGLLVVAGFVGPLALLAGGGWLLARARRRRRA